MPNLNSVMAPREKQPGHYEIDVPDGWQQGRGAYGGWVMGALARAMEHTVADPERSLRSLVGVIPGPTPTGPAEILLQPLRTGANVSTLSAVLQSQGEQNAQATAIFGKPRSHRPQANAPAPDAVDWRSVEPLPTNLPFAPRFASHFEFRVTGRAPFSGGPVAETSGWLRPRESVAWGYPEVVACSDVWWPAAFSSEAHPRPAVTVAFTLEILALPQGDEPLFHRGVVTAQDDGYMVEFRELWSSDGRLIALNQQTIAWI